MFNYSTTLNKVSLLELGISPRWFRIPIALIGRDRKAQETCLYSRRLELTVCIQLAFRMFTDLHHWGSLKATCFMFSTRPGQNMIKTWQMSEWSSTAGVLSGLCIQGTARSFFSHYPKCSAGGMRTPDPQYTINGRHLSVDISVRGLTSRHPSMNNCCLHPPRKAFAYRASIKSSSAHRDR